MAEVFFYHLRDQPLKQVLPKLISKGLKQNLKMAVQTLAIERLSALSELLWAAEDVAFLPHGLMGDDNAASQPVLLSATAENPNSATYRFFVDGAVPEKMEGLARAMIMFDGSDETAVEQARGEWKRHKADGHEISYWKQDEGGKWQNQASQ
jgi:DNA polymerase III subunit chi